MKAIQTRYLSATTHKPARIKAFTYGASKIYNLHHDGDCEHFLAASMLLKDLAWDDHLEIQGSGTLPNGDMAFILNTIEK